MNRTLIIAALGAVVVAGTALAKPKPARTYAPGEMARMRQEAQKRMYERTGGFLPPRNPGKCVAIVNQQKDVDAAFLNEVAETIRGGLQFSAVVADRRPADAGIVIEIRDCDYPATFVVAPENGYGMLNVANLKKDSPDADKLKTRVKKELWRTLVYLLGGGNDDQPKCLMKPVATLAQLDALESTCPCPMTFNVLAESASRFGVVPNYRVTYRQACMEGWAPAPTNDVQRVIMEKVKAEKSASPTNPISIKPGQKPAAK